MDAGRVDGAPRTADRPRVALRHRRPVAAGMEVVGNLVRRRLRNLLTVGGITIGVLALTTLGSMAERADTQLAGGERFLGDHIQVQASNQAGSSLIGLDALAEIRAVGGVAAAYPTLTMPAEAEPSVLLSGSSIVAFDASEYGRLAAKLPVGAGRALRPGDSGVVVVGPDMARRRGLHVGSHLTLPIPPTDGGAVATGPGRRFTVAGVLAPTLTAPDQWAILSMADAGQLVARALPGPARVIAAAGELANGVDVYGDPGADLDAIARQIQASVVGMQAIPPSAAIAAFQSLGAVYTTLTTGSALVALVVGGLSVVNTMLMAVADRVREIGIKRAIGAPAASIVAELLVESALLGVLGGLVGLGVGWALTALINVSTEATQGTGLFLLTPRLVLAVPLFSIGLGVVAGVAPALRAARLDPIRALRSAE